MKDSLSLRAYRLYQSQFLQVKKMAKEQGMGEAELIRDLINKAWNTHTLDQEIERYEGEDWVPSVVFTIVGIALVALVVEWSGLTDWIINSI